MESLDWYEEATALVKSYQKIADAHWHKAGTQWSSIDPFHARSFEDRIEGIAPNDRTANHKLIDLLRVLSHQPTLEIQAANDADPNIELGMYHNLGIWLCSYFLGVPRLDAWDRVALLANRLGAYPGGAFYDKLAGDVYRFERRQAAKNPTVPREPLYVMAFTPLVMLPDENDLTFIPQEHPNLSTEAGNFKDEVEKLACRYLRFQIWRYLRSESCLPICYSVSQVAVSEAIYSLAKKRANAAFTTIGQQRALIDYEKNQLLAESDLRVRKFFSTDRKSTQQLVVFSENATKRRGLTSCVLGAQDGVTTNRPNRSGEATAFCSWTEGIVLKTEREKVNSLWTDDKRPFRITLNETASDDFSSYWYDPSVEKLPSI